MAACSASCFPGYVHGRRQPPNCSWPSLRSSDMWSPIHADTVEQKFTPWGDMPWPARKVKIDIIAMLQWIIHRTLISVHVLMVKATWTAEIWRKVNSIAMEMWKAPCVGCNLYRHFRTFLLKSGSCGGGRCPGRGDKVFQVYWPTSHTLIHPSGFWNNWSNCSEVTLVLIER